VTLGLDAAFAREWWQLWTCHLVHWDVRHFALNAIAVTPPLVIARHRLRMRDAVVWSALAAPLLSLVLIAHGLRGEYRGASGLVVAVWVTAAMTLIRDRDRFGVVLLVAIAAKLSAEAFGVRPPPPAFETVPLAHYAGAMIGAISGLRVAIRDPAASR
jgi:membrane associated rhomboid family serine protease